MAKKPKTEAAEAAPAAAAAEGEAPKGGSKKKLVIVIAAAAAVLLAGGGGGTWYYLKKKHAAEEAAASGDGHGESGGHGPEAPKKTAFLEMKEMMVNLSGQNLQQLSERPRYLKMKITLEVSDPKIVAEVQPLLPRIEDTFQVYTRELRPTDLEGSAGVYRLKEELLRRVNVAIYPSKVDAVLFKEILIQ
jgi:flagellar protein FliL